MFFVCRLKSLHFVFNNKGRKGFGVFRIFGQNGYDIGDVGVGDKNLSAIDNVIIPVLFIVGPATCRVGTAGRFGYGRRR